MNSELIFSCLLIAACLYVDFLGYKFMCQRKGLIQTLIVKYKARIKAKITAS